MLNFGDFHGFLTTFGWQLPSEAQNPAATQAVLVEMRKFGKTIQLLAARLLPGQRPQFELYLGHTSGRDSADGE